MSGALEYFDKDLVQRRAEIRRRVGQALVGLSILSEWVLATSSRRSPLAFYEQSLMIRTKISELFNELETIQKWLYLRDAMLDTHAVLIQKVPLEDRDDYVQPQM